MDFFWCGVPVRWSTVRLTPLIRPHRPHETFTERIWGHGALDTKEGKGKKLPPYSRRMCTSTTQVLIIMKTAVFSLDGARPTHRLPFRHHWMSGQCAHGACEIRGVCHPDQPFKVYMMRARIIKVSKYFQSVLKRQRLKQRIHYSTSLS